MMRPHEATFTSGPYGHGSRVYAKVVETVIARLEKRLASDAGEHAAGIALAAKVDKAWRETYSRSLPSEKKVKQELKRLAPTGIRLFPSEAGSDPVGLNPSTAAGVGENHLAALSSGLWQTAGATRKPYVRKKSKRLLAAEAEAAARRPKRRFVLKAAAARGIGGSGSGSSKLGRKKRLRTNDGAAVNAARGEENGVAGGIRGGLDGTRGSVRAGSGQAAVDGAGGEATTRGGAAAAAVANARGASGSSPPVQGGVEGRNGHGDSGVGGGQLGRAVDRAAASRERAGEQQGEQQVTSGGGGGKRPGSGGEPPEEVEDEEEEDDDDFSLEPKRRPPASSTAAARGGGGAAAAAAAASAGADALRGEAGAGRKAQDKARENGPASATRRPDPAALAANEGEAAANGDGGSDGAAGRAGDASAVAAATAAADEDDVHSGLAGAAVPDVAVTANFVGELLKGRHRSKWRLSLEGGVIEGKDQLFVFDECECLLDPPQ